MSFCEMQIQTDEGIWLNIKIENVPWPQSYSYMLIVTGDIDVFWIKENLNLFESGVSLFPFSTYYLSMYALHRNPWHQADNFQVNLSYELVTIFVMARCSIPIILDVGGALNFVNLLRWHFSWKYLPNLWPFFQNDYWFSDKSRVAYI